MELQVAGPGVQHGGEPKRPVQALGIAAQLQQGRAGRLEEQPVDQPAVAPRHVAQLGGQGEHHVEVRDRQDACFTPIEPPGLGEALALGAVAVAARVVRDLGVVAAGAHLDVATERGRAAVLDGVDDLNLLAAHPSGRHVPRAVRAEDVSDLETRARGADC